MSSKTTKTTGEFIEPPPIGSGSSDPSTFKVYAVGDFLDVSWTTNSTSPEAVYDLVINQRNSPATQIDRTPNSDSLKKTSYKWKITTDGSDGGSKFDLTFSNQFNFILFRRDETASLADTVYFNITNSTINRFGELIKTTSSSTTRLPTSSSITSSTTVSSSSSAGAIINTSPTTVLSAETTSTSSAPPASETSATKSSGLSQQASIGVGVGVGLAAAAIIAAILVWFFLRRKRQGEKPVVEQTNNNHNSVPESAHDNWYPPAELPAASDAAAKHQEKVVRSELYG